MDTILLSFVFLLSAASSVFRLKKMAVVLGFLQWLALAIYIEMTFQGMGLLVFVSGVLFWSMPMLFYGNAEKADTNAASLLLKISAAVFCLMIVLPVFFVDQDGFADVGTKADGLISMFHKAAVLILFGVLVIGSIKSRRDGFNDH